MTYTYTQQWDVENRLVVVTSTGTSLVSRFYYDGDNKRVKHSDGMTTTVYIGALFEKNITTGVTTTYYPAGVGSTRVAMRQGSAVYYLHSDHLSSASLTTDASGNPTSQLRYLPYGAPRSGYPIGSVPTDYRFTGQRSEEASLGSLYDYGARFYSPVLGRFLSADTIVPSPGNPQSLNRYSYVLNNALKYTDPTGHKECSDADGCGGGSALPLPAPVPMPVPTPPQVATPEPPTPPQSRPKSSTPTTYSYPGPLLGRRTKIIIMPPGTSPARPRPESLRRIGMGLSIAGVLFDVGEGIEIFMPQAGAEDFSALWDVGATYLSGLASGTNYLFESPHPSLLPMVSVNQDTLVQGGDLVIAAAAKAGLTALLGPVGTAAGKGVDVLTTGASFVHDTTRTFGTCPMLINTGIDMGGNFVIIWYTQE